jgi:protein-S-isoprenylcysteine O-methyltransferase Ste14
MEKNEKVVNGIWGIIYLVGFIYSIFLPIRLNSMWFYVGILLIFPGLIIWIIVIINIIKIPQGQPFTKGAYRYSRHPMFISQSLILLGVSIIATSLIFLLLSIVLIGLLIVTASFEERSCLEHFGNAYGIYLEKTPKWIGIPKSGK